MDVNGQKNIWKEDNQHAIKIEIKSFFFFFTHLQNTL